MKSTKKKKLKNALHSQQKLKYTQVEYGYRRGIISIKSYFVQTQLIGSVSGDLGQVLYVQHTVPPDCRESALRFATKFYGELVDRKNN